MFHTEYDELHRPIEQWLKIDTAAAVLIEAFAYCDTAQPHRRMTGSTLPTPSSAT